MNRVSQLAHQPVTDTVRNQQRITQAADLLTGPGVCRLLGVSRSTWLRLRKSGVAPHPVDLPGHPRFRVSDIERMVRGGRRFLASHERLTNQPVSKLAFHADSLRSVSAEG
jgi:predicted DNA-binding transcriptional regulator AlpA